MKHKSHSVLHLLALKLLAERQIRIHLQRLILSLQSYFGSEAKLYSTKSGQIWQPQTSVYCCTLFVIITNSNLQQPAFKVFKECEISGLRRFAHLPCLKLVVVWARRMDLNVAASHKSLLRRYPHVLSPSFHRPKPTKMQWLGSPKAHFQRLKRLHIYSAPTA